MYFLNKISRWQNLFLAHMLNQIPDKWRYLISLMQKNKKAAMSQSRPLFAKHTKWMKMHFWIPSALCASLELQPIMYYIFCFTEILWKSIYFAHLTNGVLCSTAYRADLQQLLQPIVLLCVLTCLVWQAPVYNTAKGTKPYCMVYSEHNYKWSLVTAGEWFELPGLETNPSWPAHLLTILFSDGCLPRHSAFVAFSPSLSHYCTCHSTLLTRLELQAGLNDRISRQC